MRKKMKTETKLNVFGKMRREHIEDFQGILRLLVDFDEKTGRYQRYRDQETHYARHALAVCDPEQMSVYIKDLGGYVYSVIAECRNASSVIVTAWMLEDGIRQERETAPEDHPVHKIKCLTDMAVDQEDIGAPHPEVMILMEDR